MSSHQSTSQVSTGVELATVDPTNNQSANQTNGHPYPSNEPADSAAGDQQLVRQQSMRQGNSHMSAYQKLLASLWTDMPNLSITYRDASYQYLVPSNDGAIPGVDKSLWSFLLLKHWTSKPSVFTAMQPNTGIIRPGTMTLLLAPPGHAKSTLMKTLAGRYNGDKRLSGSVKWNGLTAAESRAQGININRMTAFVDQGEAHNALMTVRETFQFALNNAVADPALLKSPEFINQSAQKVDYMIDLLGLREAENTILGNAMIRGVSGGQRRRVSIGEMIITDARAVFLDEITTGLDAKVSFDILNSLRTWTRQMNGSVVTALLQPTPECFDLFDRLILLRHGAVVYDGPREGVEQYFNSIGIPIPDDQDLGDFISDFLTDPSMVYYRTLYRASRRAGHDLAAQSVTEDVTSMGSSELPNQPSVVRATSSEAPLADEKEGVVITVTTGEAQSNASADQPAKSNQVSSSKAKETLLLAQKIPSPPLSTAALKAAWVASKYNAENLRDIEAVESQPKHNWVNEWSEYTKAQFASSYPRTYMEHLRYNFRRSADDMKRNKGFYMPRIFQAVFMGFILGALFYQTDPSNYQAKLGLLIFTIVNIAFANASEIPFAAQAKEIVFKQVDAGFYPTSSYAMSVIITNLPVSIIESVIMSVIIYFLLGFSLDAGRFFFFLFTVWLTNIALSVVFRGITWATKNADIANLIAPPVVATMFLSAGYLILYNSFPRWLIWLYELSPFTWALRSLAINEFYDDRFTGPSVDSRFPGMSAGESYLRGWDIDPTWDYKWAGVGYVIGFFFIFAAVSSLVLSHTRYPLTTGTRRFEDEEEADAVVEQAQDRLDKRVAVNGAQSGEPTVADDQPAVLSAQHRERAVASAVKYASSFKLQTAATALPFIPVDLAWRDIHYTVTVKDEEGKTQQRKLLAGIDGFATAGSLTALMGSSGAGKTTLMDVIAGRKTAGKIEGDILVNGYPKRTKTFNRLCGYVEQTDNHNPALTVRESLAFSAKLRLPRAVTAEQRDKFVEEILDILELKPIADRIVGDDTTDSRLSPSQLKRVTIGVELASNPSVLFLDEPTSGLDSRAALIVMRVVKRIANTGRAVLCTIHQPSQELFFLFDRLLLLKSGGQTVFFGNIGDDGEDLVNYFQNAPVPAGAVKPHRSPTTNPASWMLDVISAQQSHKPQADYLQIYANSQLRQAALKDLEPLLKPNTSRPELEFDNQYAASYATQYYEVQKRMFTSYWRNPSFVWIRQGLMIFLGAFLGFLYLQLGEGSQQSIITKLSAILVGNVFPSWTVMSSALSLFMRWRTVYYREQSARMYAPFTYSLASTVTEIFYTCWSSILFLALFYPMVGFPNNADSFFRFFFVHYLHMFVWISMGQFLGAALPNIMVGNILASMLGTFALLFSGMFRLAGSMPPGWKWLYYILWLPKALIPHAVVVFECTDDCTILENVQGPDNSNWGTLTSYQYALQYLGAGAWYWEWIGYLFLTIVVFRIFFFICVSKVSYLER